MKNYNTKLDEFNKLERYLKENNIRYSREDKDPISYSPFNGTPIGEFHKLAIFDEEGNILWDAICHYGSYGYEEGLLEVMGEYFIGHDDVEGYLTAEDVIKMIEKSKKMKVYVVHYFLDFGPDCSDQYDVEKCFSTKDKAEDFIVQQLKEIASKNEGDIDLDYPFYFEYEDGDPYSVTYFISEMEVE